MAPSRCTNNLRLNSSPGHNGPYAIGLLAICLLAVVGCQQEMADQPSFQPMEPCGFFPDQRSERPFVSGTVARGHLRTDRALYTGRRGSVGRPIGAPFKRPDNQSAAVTAPSDQENEQFVDTFPMPITQSVLEHGYHRFMIFCVVCHDPLGTGQGKIVERGYTPPPSYHIPRLREAPPGRFFAVITEGYGAMPSYGAQIPPRDRWAIAAYIRALQLSQHYPEGQLSAEMRAQMDRLGGNAAQGGPP